MASPGSVHGSATSPRTSRGSPRPPLRPSPARRARSRAQRGARCRRQAPRSPRNPASLRDRQEARLPPQAPCSRQSPLRSRARPERAFGQRALRSQPNRLRLREAAGDPSRAAKPPSPAETRIGRSSSRSPAAEQARRSLAAPMLSARLPTGDSRGGTCSRQPAEGAAAATAGEAIAARLAPVLARVAATVRSSVETLARLIAALSAKAAPLAQSSAETDVGRVLGDLREDSHAFAAASWRDRARARETAALYAKEAAARAGALLARIKPSPSAHENEVSSSPDALSSPTPARIGGYDLSQMLIISGVVLLVCGGLLVGSGLVLRAPGAAGTLARDGGGREAAVAACRRLVLRGAGAADRRAVGFLGRADAARRAPHRARHQGREQFR